MSVNFDFSTFQRTGDPAADLQTYMNATGKSEADAKADLKAQFGDPTQPSVFGNNTTSAANGTSYEGMSIGDILAQAGIEDSDDILEEAGVDENLSIIDFLKGWINSLVSGKDEKAADTDTQKTGDTQETSSNSNKTTKKTSNNKTSGSKNSTKTTSTSNNKEKEAKDKAKSVAEKSGYDARTTAAVGDTLATGKYTGSREEVARQVAKDRGIPYEAALAICDEYARR